MKTRMFFGATPVIFKYAQHLRKQMTEAEKLLWNYLKDDLKGCKFRRQHPLKYYVADFYCHKAKLVIEIDGSFHDNEIAKENDAVRQRLIEEEGLKVIRFQNKDVFRDVKAVLRAIESHLPDLPSKSP